MHKLNPTKVGLALGGLFGLIHLVWSVLVALNWGQPLLDFIFKLHMIHPVYTVGPFNMGIAVMLIVITAIIGYIVGHVFTLIWNKVHKA